MWGSWIRVKKFRFFQAISQTKIDFSGQISEKFLCFRQFKKFRFYRKISEQFQLFSGNFIKKSIFLRKFSKNFDFSREISRKSRFLGNFTKISIFHAKIGYLQLFLGKLFYFSSKVTTFEHTSCT